MMSGPYSSVGPSPALEGERPAHAAAGPGSKLGPGDKRRRARRVLKCARRAFCRSGAPPAFYIGRATSPRALVATRLLGERATRYIMRRRNRYFSDSPDALQ